MNNREIKKELGIIEKIFSWLLIQVFKWGHGLRKEMWIYKGANWIIQISKNRTVIKGIENLPKQSAFVIAMNHMGSWNLPFIVASLVAILQRPIFIVVEERLWQKDRELCEKWLAFIARTDFCVLSMRRKVNQGQIIGITPTGTRDNSIMQEARKGVGYLSQYTLVVPVKFWATNSDTVLQGLVGLLKVLFVKKIKIKIGQPINIISQQKLLEREILNRAKLIVDKIYSLQF